MKKEDITRDGIDLMNTCQKIKALYGEKVLKAVLDSAYEALKLDSQTKQDEGEK